MKVKTQKLNPVLAAAVLLTTFGTVQFIQPKTALALHNCGRLNQKACKVTHRGPRCRKGLKVKKKICIAKKSSSKDLDKAMRKRAKAIVKKTKPQRKILKKIRKCIAKKPRRKAFKTALNNKNPNAAYRAISGCFSARQLTSLRAIPRGVGRTGSKFHNTVTFGLGAGSIGGVGAGASAGIVINLNKPGPAVRLFTTGETGIGVGLSIGADVQLGLSTSTMPTAPKVEHGTSIVFGGKFLAGGSVSVDFSRFRLNYIPKDTVYEGFTVAGGPGFGVEIGTKYNTLTKIW